jgi:Protein of unknown function (Hypoth_ymh)
MLTLLAIFPQSNDLLALEPEELGGVILEIQNGGTFTIHSLREPLFPVVGLSYPRDQHRTVTLAIAEALTWLVSQGLLIIDPEQPAAWYLPTRRSQTLRSRGDVEAYRKGRMLPIDLLQPALADKVWPMFLRGDHDVAVFQAFKDVEIAVRNAANAKGAGYPDDLVGVSLMRAAFHPNLGELRDVDLVAGEREAEMHMFGGAIGHAKNPGSHRDVALAPQAAARLIVFASHLLGIVEQRA